MATCSTSVRQLAVWHYPTAYEPAEVVYIGLQPAVDDFVEFWVVGQDGAAQHKVQQLDREQNVIKGLGDLPLDSDYDDVYEGAEP